MDYQQSDEYSNEEWEAICKEFTRTKDQHYLDHAGTTLYAESQMSQIYDNFTKNLYCNPHTSKTTEDLIDQVRYKVLQSFNTTTDEYSIVFTSGTTGSLKLIAENFDFKNSTQTQSGHFVHVRDNHTSVLGMREIVNTPIIGHVERNDLLKMVQLNLDPKIDDDNIINSLLVLPAQCNFNGFKYPLELIDSVRRGVLNTENNIKSNWYVCLDAASYVSTNSLDLEKYKPDFVCISFYKIFGYPTGLGAMIVSQRGQKVLQKQYYGGGTVKIAMSGLNWHQKRDCFHERFEDGTIPFLSIISLLSGFNTLERLIPPREKRSTMNRISRHTFNLARYLYTKLDRLRYFNGEPVIKLYHDTDFQTIDQQGAIVNFNVLKPDGSYVGFAEIACMASIYNIYLRTGCFCNPGACQRHLKLSNKDLKEQFQSGHICGDSNDLIDGIPTGSVRISIGYMTSKSNIDALLRMINECYVLQKKVKQFSDQEIKNNYKIDAIALRSSHQTNGISNGHSKPSSNKIKLKQICIYPIKSCGAFRVKTKWPLTSRGLKYDREWMIVNSNGTALTQKNDTKLCLILPSICENAGFMELSFPYMNSIRITLNLNEEAKHSRAKICQSKVCGDRVEGTDCGDDVAKWLCDALSISGLRLLRQSSEDRRIAKNRLGNDSSCHSISLSNQDQFLLINTTSVRWLAEKVPDWNDLPEITDEEKFSGIVDRFRGNLIIDAPDVLEELQWNEVEIGNIILKSNGACTRCQMICIDQRTGEKTTEPLKTIAREFKGKMKFGLYLSQMISNHHSDDVVLICCDNDLVVRKTID